jgi:hypothetical protein
MHLKIYFKTHFIIHLKNAFLNEFQFLKFHFMNTFKNALLKRNYIKMHF